MKNRIISLLLVLTIVCSCTSIVLSEGEIHINKGSLSKVEMVPFAKYDVQVNNGTDKLEFRFLKYTNMNANTSAKCLYLNYYGRTTNLYLEEIDEIIAIVQYIMENAEQMIHTTQLTYKSSEGLEMEVWKGSSESATISSIEFSISNSSFRISLDEADSFIAFLQNAKAELEAWNP